MKRVFPKDQFPIGLPGRCFPVYLIHLYTEGWTPHGNHDTAQFVKKWSEIKLKERTTAQSHFSNALTLYNEECKGRQRDPRLWAGGPYGDILSLEQIETLDHIHTRLDQSVLEAYGWPQNLSDEGILERLLALNLERVERG